MPDQVIKQLSSKILAWLLGIVGLALVFIGSLIFTFYTDWLADEATEDMEKKSLMFDSPEQKEEHKDHVNESVSALDQKIKVIQDSEFQKQVLKKLEDLARIDTLNAHQIYQIKEQLNNR